MLPVKLPYYPQVTASRYVTPFGVSVVDKATVYDKPLTNGKHLVRVDALSSLYDILGTEPFICRDLTFQILSGDDRYYDLKKVFASYYRKYKKVTEYVNNLYVYGNNVIPMFDRAVKPLRNRVDNYTQECITYLRDHGGKYLVESADYIYFAFEVLPDLSKLSGVTIIC